MHKKLSGIFLLLVTSYWLLVPVIASAAIIPDCNPLPGNPRPANPVPGTRYSCSVDDLFGLLINIYNFLLGMLAFVAVLVIIVAGVRMILHSLAEGPVGSSSRSELENAKVMLARAIWGIIIIATAWLVVNTVLVVLGVRNTGPGSVGDLLTRWGLLGP